MVTAELGACEWFVYELRRSNLIERGHLDQIVSDFLRHNPRSEPKVLAQYLVDEGILSKFQAERVLANKAQGLVLGPYVLVDVLGSGSMGTVFRAVSKNDQQHYAVKVLPRRSMWNVRLARRQVRQFSQFSHPSIAPFVDVGTSGGMHYLVWPLIEGQSLEALVQQQGKLSPDHVAKIGWQIADGLNVCHQNGIFHGLLKPSNIMIGPHNRVTILDFGIGSLLAENEGESLVDTMSTANTLTSGLDCSSPESILEPTNRTPAGDQYSLGCILYFCLAGRYAFAEGSAVEKMMAHQFKDPTPLKEIVPETPEKLAEIVHKLMRKKPEDRFRGTDDVADELQPLAGAAAVAEAPPAAAEQKPSPRLALSTLRDRTVRRAQIAASGVVTPPASPYPQAPYPAPAPPVSTPAPKAASAADSHSSNTDHRPMPTRQLLEEQDEAEPEAVYTPPPGYVAEGDVPPPMSPIFFTVLGMGVMLIAYMALTMLRPF